LCEEDGYFTEEWPLIFISGKRKYVVCNDLPTASETASKNRWRMDRWRRPQCLCWKELVRQGAPIDGIVVGDVVRSLGHVELL
jgi:hypothetical protein